MGEFDDVQGGGSSTAPNAQRTYTVQRGDSLSKIAKQMYGDAKQWRRIADANKDRIKNPDVIQPGWVLTIP
jgi:nucleoid-associated protein YgaU